MRQREQLSGSWVTGSGRMPESVMNERERERERESGQVSLFMVYLLMMAGGCRPRSIYTYYIDEFKNGASIFKSIGRYVKQ